jgi:hypothetical protein
MAAENREEVHLVTGYLRRDREGNAVDIPLSACDQAETEGHRLVSIYPHGDESLITCTACLAWLAEEDNRLLLLDVGEWIRKHAAAGDRNLRYIDIPVPGD